MPAIGIARQNAGQGRTADGVPAIPLVRYNIQEARNCTFQLLTNYRGMSVRGADEARDTRGSLKQ